MDIDTVMKILALGTDHKWLALAIVLMGWLTSLTSNWSKFPFTLPPRLQPVLVIVLGQVYAILLAVQGGQSWIEAAKGGLIAAFVTMGLYAAVVKAVFNGNVPAWLAFFSFAKKDAPQQLEIKKPTTFGILIFLGAGFLFASQEACGLLTPAQEAKAVDAGGKIACVIEKEYLDDALLDAACGLVTAAEKASARTALRAHKDGVKKALSAQKLSACGPATAYILVAPADAGSSTRVDGGATP